MNNYLSFHTPTQVDLRELFTLGLGSKRGATDKIGHKGSGLKFTLGVNGKPGESWRIAVTYPKAVVGKRIGKAAMPSR